MSFDAQEQKIRKIFSGETKFKIPRNQRKYVWDEKQWRELLEDIKYIYIQNKNSKTDITHFFGSFVLQEELGDYVIIDGQQRITTLMVILSSICVLFNELECEEEFGITKQFLLGNINLSSQYVRIENDALFNLTLLVNQVAEYRKKLTSKTLLDTRLYRKDEQNKKILSCFHYYYQQFQELIEEGKDKVENLRLIRSTVLNMKVVHIVSEDELDCYDIFEILNARGVDLEESELLKNFIFKYSRPKYQIDTSKELWKQIESNMEQCNSNMEQFLMHFTTYRFKKPQKQENVFRIIKSQSDKSNISKLLDDLLEDSHTYTYFYNPQSAPRSKITKTLEFFKIVNHRQFRPLFLALMNANVNGQLTDKDVDDIFIFLRNFYFAFGTICGGTSNVIDYTVHDFSRKIYLNPCKEVLEELKVSLKKYYPEVDTFKANFCEVGYSNKNPKYTNSNNGKRINYIFNEIENYLQITDEVHCSTENCNIEHIMCDSKEEDTPCKIGNLILIAENINSNMKDKAYKEKIELMKKSEMMLVKNFIKHYGENEIWTVDNIRCRGEKLAFLAYNKVWLLS